MKPQTPGVIRFGLPVYAGNGVGDGAASRQQQGDRQAHADSSGVVTGPTDSETPANRSDLRKHGRLDRIGELEVFGRPDLALQLVGPAEERALGRHLAGVRQQRAVAHLEKVADGNVGRRDIRSVEPALHLRHLLHQFSVGIALDHHVVDRLDARTVEDVVVVGLLDAARPGRRRDSGPGRPRHRARRSRSRGCARGRGAGSRRSRRR